MKNNDKKAVLFVRDAGGAPMTTHYAAQCPHCRKAQAVKFDNPATFTLKCRRCNRSTKYLQHDREHGRPFNAFLLKGPYHEQVVPKAVAAWNLRTFGPTLEPPPVTLDNFTEASA